MSKGTCKARERTGKKFFRITSSEYFCKVVIVTIDLSLAFLKVKKSRARKEKRQSRRLAKSRFYHSPPLPLN